MSEIDAIERIRPLERLRVIEGDGVNLKGIIGSPSVTRQMLLADLAFRTRPL
jgi:hypothetical protein